MKAFETPYPHKSTIIKIVPKTSCHLLLRQPGTLLATIASFGTEQGGRKAVRVKDPSTVAIVGGTNDGYPISEDR